MKTALGRAEHVLAVSESFAEIYRGCGVERVLAVPNGLPPMPAVVRSQSATGRVRLLHVGNIAKHKGFHLIQAALRQSAFANLELVVVDHAASSGSIRHDLWGTTPIQIIGKRAQEQVHTLYGVADVLVAPSTWPESFGLVTREALSCGCWILASGRGAVEEDVIPGVNGLVVDVASPEGLINALGEINADPHRFLQPPPAPPLMRSADDQATEVLSLYREILASSPAALHLTNGRPRWEGRVHAASARARRVASDLQEKKYLGDIVDPKLKAQLELSGTGRKASLKSFQTA